MTRTKPARRETPTQEKRCTEPPWQWSRAECLAGRALWADCPVCAERHDLDAYCRLCDAAVERAYDESGGLRRWRRYADQSLATLDWGWLGREAATVRAVAEALPAAIERGEGLLLAGGAGCGKTHIAVGLGLVTLAHGYTVYAATFGDVLLSLRAGFDDGCASEAAEMERLCTTDLLILDDLGFEKPSAWSIDRLAYLFNRRYSEQRSTLVTTGFHPSCLDEMWGETVMGRLYAVAPLLLLDGVADYRPVERARRQDHPLPHSAHWPGTEAEIVIGEEDSQE
jgi:hypothetical protein